MIDGAKPPTLPTAIHEFAAAHETEYNSVDEVGVVARLQAIPFQCITTATLVFQREVPMPTHIVVETQETECSRLFAEKFGDGTIAQEAPSHFNTSVCPSSEGEYEPTAIQKVGLKQSISFRLLK
jgi:hypothetical protein